MKILFVGQRGVPSLDGAATERRVEALAQMLAEEGHEVTVTCGQPFVPKNINDFNGVKLAHLFSLDPGKADGWVRTVLEMGLIWWTNPDVVHVHSWRMAALCRVAVLLRPETTFVWTVDALPHLPRWAVGRVARRAAKMFDAVTVPTRALQYSLARDIKVAAEYVPDGYVASNAPDIPLKHFGLRKGQQYALALAEAPADVRQVAKAYDKAGLRKKVAVLQEPKGASSRLAKKFTFLHFVGEQSGRRLATLLSQASVVVAGQDVSSDSVLQAMEYGRPIVVLAPSPAEEVLGGAALFVKAGDEEGLAQVLKSVLNSKRRQTVWGAKAHRRARAHFTWTRILPEYEALYHYPLVRAVALDSAIRPSFTELPAVR